MLTPIDGELVEMSFEDYHKHPAFSSSTAKTLIAESPAHAKAERDNGSGSTRATDKGAIGHRLLLGAGDDFEIIRFDDYKKKAAQEARDAARRAKRVPILEHEHDEISTAVDHVRQRLAGAGVLLDGVSEQTILWNEADAATGLVQPCRCRVDHLRIGEAKAQILEVKTCATAAPRAIQLAAENMGYAIATAAYKRGVEAALPSLRGCVEYYFIFIELVAPYAINFCAPDAAFEQVGAMRWERAVRTWFECDQSKTWPSYGAGVNKISVPPWVLSRIAAGEEY